MSFFKKIFGIIASLGFVCMLAISAFFIISFVRNEQKIEKNEQKIDIYLENQIEEFQYSIFNETLNLTVIFLDDNGEDYFLSYAYYYFDTYGFKINLLVLTENKNYFIVINNSENSCVLV